MFLSIESWNNNDLIFLFLVQFIRKKKKKTLKYKHHLTNLHVESENTTLSREEVQMRDKCVTIKRKQNRKIQMFFTFHHLK